MVAEGSKQVPLVGKKDKREKTVFLTISASGVYTTPSPWLFTKGKLQDAILRLHSQQTRTLLIATDCRQSNPPDFVGIFPLSDDKSCFLLYLRAGQ